MVKQREVFENRRKEFIKGAENALARLRDGVDEFNGVGIKVFVIGSLRTLKEKSADGWVTSELRKRLAAFAESEGGFLSQKVCKKAVKFRAIDARLSAAAQNIRNVLAEYERLIIWDKQKECFLLDDDKLTKEALSYADEL